MHETRARLSELLRPLAPEGHTLHSIDWSTIEGRRQAKSLLRAEALPPFPAWNAWLKENPHLFALHLALAEGEALEEDFDAIIAYALVLLSWNFIHEVGNPIYEDLGPVWKALDALGESRGRDLSDTLTDVWLKKNGRDDTAHADARMLPRLLELIANAGFTNWSNNVALREHVSASTWSLPDTIERIAPGQHHDLIDAYLARYVADCIPHARILPDDESSNIGRSIARLRALSSARQESIFSGFDPFPLCFIHLAPTPEHIRQGLEHVWDTEKMTNLEYGFVNYVARLPQTQGVVLRILEERAEGDATPMWAYWSLIKHPDTLTREAAFTTLIGQAWGLSGPFQSWFLELLGREPDHDWREPGSLDPTEDVVNAIRNLAPLLWTDALPEQVWSALLAHAHTMGIDTSKIPSSREALSAEASLQEAERRVEARDYSGLSRELEAPYGKKTPSATRLDGRSQYIGGQVAEHPLEQAHIVPLVLWWYRITGKDAVDEKSIGELRDFVADAVSARMLEAIAPHVKRAQHLRRLIKCLEFVGVAHISAAFVGFATTHKSKMVRNTIIKLAAEIGERAFEPLAMGVHHRNKAIATENAEALLRLAGQEALAGTLTGAKKPHHASIVEEMLGTFERDISFGGTYDIDDPPNANRCIAELREVVHSPPTDQSWAQAMDILQRCIYLGEIETAMSYLQPHLAAWGEAPHRFVPFHFAKIDALAPLHTYINPRWRVWLPVSSLRDSTIRAQIEAGLAEDKRTSRRRSRFMEPEHIDVFITCLKTMWKWCDDNGVDLSCVELRVDGGGAPFGYSGSTYGMELVNGYGFNYGYKTAIADKLNKSQPIRIAKATIPKDHPARSRLGMAPRKRVLDLRPLLFGVKR